MLNSEIVQAWLDEATTTLTFDESPVVPEGVESLDASECDELLARLSVIKQAVGFLQSSAKARMAHHLGSRGFVRFGERTYRAGPKRTVTVRPEARAEFWGFVQEHAAAERLFNPNQHRTTGMRELAKEFVDSETGEVGWDAFAARFLEIEEGEVQVSEIPANRAPQFIQKSPDGQVEYRGDAA